MKPFILSLLLAASLSAKVVTKSCPICGQCEPDVMQISTYNWLGDEYLLCFVCDSNGIVFRNQVGDDTIKWVPKQIEVKPFTGLKTVTLDTGSAPCRPIGPKKRKCVDAVYPPDSLFGSWTLVNRDTTWCNCDGDSTYWRVVVTREKPYTHYGDYTDTTWFPLPDTIYTRIESRWRRETKKVWVKRKKTIKEVWE